MIKHPLSGSRMIRNPGNQAHRIVALACLLMAMPSLALGRAASSVAGSDAQASQASAAIIVAVLPFEAAQKFDRSLGKEISSVIGIRLSGGTRITVVDRQHMEAVYRELAMGAHGVATQPDPHRLGRLLQAEVLVSGRLFALGAKTYLSASVTELATSRMQGVIVEQQSKDIMLDVMRLAERLQEQLDATAFRQNQDAAKERRAAKKAADVWYAFRDRLNGKMKRTVAVMLPEAHLNEPAEQAGIDPAVEIELQKRLIDSGVVVKRVTAEQRAAWTAGKHTDLDGIDLVLEGEAFSEFSGRLGPFATCTARAEVKLVEAKTGEIIFADRVMTTGIDVGVRSAGKRALQKAGRQLAVRVLNHFVKNRAIQDGS